MEIRRNYGITESRIGRSDLKHTARSLSILSILSIPSIQTFVFCLLSFVFKIRHNTEKSSNACHEISSHHRVYESVSITNVKDEYVYYHTGYLCHKLNEKQDVLKSDTFFAQQDIHIEIVEAIKENHQHYMYTVTFRNESVINVGG